MTKPKQKDNTPAERAIYLMFIAADYIRDNAPSERVIFDDAECDGMCLADDLESAAKDLARH